MDIWYNNILISPKELKWHHFFMKIAQMYADLSKDPRLKVGSVLVSSDFRKILSSGFNGWAKGEPDIPDALGEGSHGTIHSECNCLIFCDNKQQYPNCYFYCTINPCRICSRMIVNFGTISTVVYEDDYRDVSGIKILESAGIKVIKLNDI